MEYTVKALAQLAGVSPRTLRWYDKIGLLQPQRGENGYRRYGPKQVDRLQQILLYRAAGMELEAIGRLLDAPDFDPGAALARHLEALRQRRVALDTLIDTAQKTLQTLRGETTMTDKEKFEGFKQKLVDDNEAQYGEEVRQRWGNEAANAANAKMLKMTKDEYEAFEALGQQVLTTLAAAVAEGDPAGPAAQKTAALHKEWLCKTWGTAKYNGQAHKNLAQMYVDDERFAAYYEKAAPGGAAMLRDAVAWYVDHS